MVLDIARRIWRSIVPLPARLRIRRSVADLPHRLLDALPDLAERLLNLSPLPPARLRARVGLTSSRREFKEVGRAGASALLAALDEAGYSNVTHPRWVDFGCGSGRIGRHLGELRNIRQLVGVDVDREAVEWCRRHLPGDYAVIGERPPTAMASHSADVICAVSVFTHMDEPAQRSWLQELHRLLRPGGFFVLTSHSPELTWTRPDLTAEQHRELASRGFLFAPAPGPFNDHSTFQTDSFLNEFCSGLFTPKLFQPFGLGGYQDLSVWERKIDLSDETGPSAAAPPTVSG